MPELPEVQTTVNGLNRVAKGHRIIDVWTDYNSPHYHGSDTIKDPQFFAEFKKSVVGRTILGVERRAKNILVHLDAGSGTIRGGKAGRTHAVPLTMLIHMKMTGHIICGQYLLKKASGKSKGVWVPAPDERPALFDPFNKFIHFVITISNAAKTKQIVLSDMRKFAKVTLIPTAALEQSEHLRDIGPEPLGKGFGPEEFFGRLKLRPQAKIKAALLDQSIVAGIGNIYTDESLWRAGIHPKTLVKNISKSKLRGLYTALRATLSKGIDFGGDSMSDYRNIDGVRGRFQEQHRAYRKTGTACMRSGCKGVIRRIVVAGRGTHYCDIHQTEQKN